MTTISPENASALRTAAPAIARSGGASSQGLPKGWLGVPIRAWVMLGLLGALFVALYWDSLVRLWLKTNPYNGVSEWAHAIFVPIIGAYYLFLNLDDLLKAKVRPLIGFDFTPRRFISAGVVALGGLLLWKVLPNLPGPFTTYTGEIEALGQGLLILSGFVAALDWGVGTLLAGLLTYAYGIAPGANDFVKDVGMVMSVFGAVLTVAGWEIMRTAWFPCVFLLCALPWPGLFYSKAAMPMQELSAHVAVTTMRLVGVDVENSGTQIIINRPGASVPRVLNVAEACAGLKSLMTFVSLGAAVAFLSSRALWQKLLITASAVPIAIACNAVRVSGQGFLDYYVGEEWSAGFAHQFAGIVFLLPGFLTLLGLVWLLDTLFVEVDEADEGAIKAGGAA